MTAVTDSTSFWQKMGVPLQVIPALLNNENTLKSAQQIVKDRSLFSNVGQCMKCMGIDAQTTITADTVKDIVGDSEKSSFLRHFNNTQWDVGIDVDDAGSISSGLEQIQDKHVELESSCADEAYQKYVNMFYITYFGFSVANLCLSWWKLSETLNNVKWAKSKLAEYKTTLSNIDTKNIQQIKQYHDKICRQGVIDNIHEYRMYDSMIQTVLDSLNALQRECRAQQEMLNRETRQNAMSAFTLGHSGWTSWSLSALFPEAAIALKALSLVQGTTAVAHCFAAVECYKMSDEFVALEKKVASAISDLTQIKADLSQYEAKMVMQVSLWDTSQVVQWTKAQSANQSKIFDDIADVFQQENVNGQDLLEMDHAILEEMGMTNRLHRKRLLREIAALKQRQR